MQDKHKVTLYLPPELHRQLKIRSAVELEPMSAIAERAIVFYLTHSDIVDEVEMSHGHSHQIYNCPSCSTSVVLREGEMFPVSDHPAILPEDGETPIASLDEAHATSKLNIQQDEELVPC